MEWIPALVVLAIALVVLWRIKRRSDNNDQRPQLSFKSPLKIEPVGDLDLYSLRHSRKDTD